MAVHGRSNQTELEAKSLLKKFLIGMLFGISIYFVFAGLSEVFLARDSLCRESTSRLRLSPNPDEICLPEWQVLMLHAASRGIFGLFFPSAGAYVAWIGMAILYSMVGGVSTRFRTRTSLIMVFTFMLGFTALMAGMGYLSKFILLPWI